MQAGSGHRASGPDRESGRALHARLLRRDPTAPSDLAATYLAPLVAWLGQTFPRDDDALLETIAIDLMLGLAEHPERYDPDRLPLERYLRMAARGDVKNARDAARRRAARLTSLEGVELLPSVRNSRWAHAQDFAGRVADVLDDERLAAMLEQMTGRDREVVELMLDGERRTTEFATILELQDRPLDEQVREVKRAKDRLKKKMQRLWRRTAGDG
jgi:hypothetical protein